MGIMTRLVRIALAGLLVVWTVGAAAAGPAADHVHESIDAVLKILADPDLKTKAKTVERRRAIRIVANELFDFAELSRRSLATHWAARTPAERQEFIALFTDLLEKSYITTIEEYTGETILVLQHRRAWGPTVILSDGDVVFQPRKVERSGISEAVDGHVLIYIHKEQELEDVEERYPARHYVLVDDKPRILAAVKKIWGDRVTTVLPRQGQYANDARVLASLPPADV